MTSLDEFRMETRAWLQENCPQEMRKAVTVEDDICWGGRNWTFKSEAQKLWLERMAARVGPCHTGRRNTAEVA